MSDTGPDPDHWSIDATGPDRRPLHPLPRGLVELYGLLAVLVVLIPEWIAGGALLGVAGDGAGTALPPQTQAWQRLPELRLASMTLAELRRLAADLQVAGYGRLAREPLTARLLRRLGRPKAL
ncbi:MAG: Rho termination factor N-terminal domain-containing protein [Cyanobium sp.]|nr:Rho termination factor N-terminal domain-containing protein [Cyanobium sp.]